MQSKQVRICWRVLRTQYTGYGPWLDITFDELQKQVCAYNEYHKGVIQHWVEIMPPNLNTI